MIEVIRPQHNINCTLKLPGSKSISNRLLILNKLLQQNSSIENLSDSDDTRLLQKAIEVISNSKTGHIDIEHAGSDMRFLTALLAISPGEWILTGSERMKERPIGELVTALKQLGADIQYVENDNFPPLKISGKKLKGGALQIDASVSSQFVSALLLIALEMENGLELELTGKTVSRPYINMTVDILKNFGAGILNAGNTIKVRAVNIPKQSSVFIVESDWSSSSYWYSICALSPGSSIELKFLNKESLQADSILPELYQQLGVETVFSETGIQLLNKEPKIKMFNYDFTNCPDIAQTLAVTCFGLGISATLTGLQTLKVKETDRINALKTELEKLGASVQTTDVSLIISSDGSMQQAVANNHIIETYNDHRMAMSFAPLALVCQAMCIKTPEVVSKSYPGFWNDLKTAGFSVNLKA